MERYGRPGYATVATLPGALTQPTVSSPAGLMAPSALIPRPSNGGVEGYIACNLKPACTSLETYFLVVKNYGASVGLSYHEAENQYPMVRWAKP